MDERTLSAGEEIAGLRFTEQERALMLPGVEKFASQYEQLRAQALSNGVPPAVQFSAILPGTTIATTRHSPRFSESPDISPVPPSDELALLSVMQLAHLIRTRKVTSLALTELYLERLRRYDKQLHCVVTLTEELGLEQARQADREIAAGQYRGPLHGIPWGAKDLLAVKGYPTTWGSAAYRDQMLDQDATVVERLAQAGAVLVAKLSLGELAMGDVWFGGRTNNPWNLEEGASGSSAGAGAAVGAGLVGFALGSETRGSIVSPSTRCGVTGTRPTFGRVSRNGAMALSWSMDKIGPMCRSVEDCALVLAAIAGPDGKDGTVVDAPFNWDGGLDVRRLRVGYVQSAFDDERKDQAQRLNDLAVLDVLRTLGFDLQPIALPDLPVDAMAFILTVEAAAAFDELTRSDRDDLLVRQTADAWPNLLRQARLIPAVEYLQANRLRTLAMRAMAEVMNAVDVYVAPTFGNANLALTNLTGHPAVCVPNGFTTTGSPTSITFTGRLFGEAELLAVAKTYQDATAYHRQHPILG